MATGRLVHRGVSFRTRALARSYAEDLLDIPGVLKLFTEHAQADGRFSPDADPAVIEVVTIYSKDRNPDRRP
jgi:hypothetical protein